MLRKFAKYFNFQLLSTLLIICLSQGFFVWLMMSSLNDYRRTNLEALISLSTETTAANINAVTTLGRDIANYPRASQLIYDLMLKSKSADAFITDEDGKIVLGLSRSGLDTLPLKLLAGERLTIGERSYCVMPFYDVKGAVNGYVAAELQGSEELQFNLSSLPSNFLIKVGAMLALSALVCIFFTLRRHQRHPQDKPTFKSFIGPFIIAQLLILSVTLPPFKNMVDDYVGTANITMAGFIHSQFAHVAALDLNFTEVSGIDEYIAEVKSRMPAIGHLSIVDARGELIAGDELVSGTAVSMPVVGANSGLMGYILLKENSSFILSFVIKLGLSLATLLFIAAILAYELSTLTGFEAQRLGQKRKLIPCEITLPRPIAFCLVFAFYLPIAVTPVYMGRFVQDFAGLDETLIRSFAVSTEMLAVGLSSLLLLIFAAKFGPWLRILKLGICLLTLGMGGSFFAQNGYHFLLARFCYGLGYGCVLVSLQLFAVAITTKAERGTSFAGLFAGLYSGVLCGGCAGGLLAEKFGQQNIYAISALMLILNLILISYLLGHRLTQSTAPEGSQEARPFKLRNTLTFMKNPQVFSLLFFQAIPYAVITIGFFNFFMPIFVTAQGFGTDTAGQLNFLYSLCIILLTPLCGKIMDKSRRKYIILASGLLASASVPLIFNLDLPLLAVTLAMIMLGISASINEGGQPLVISTYEAADTLGSNNAIMVLDIVLRIGQIIGPLIVASIFASFGSQALGGIGIVCVLLLIIFTLIQKKAEVATCSNN